MSDFEHQRIIFKAIEQFRQVQAVIIGIFERPGKLKQHCAQFFLTRQGVHSLAYSLLVFQGSLATFMCKSAVEFCREHEIGRGNTTRPGVCSSSSKGPVKAAINFNGVEEASEIFKRIKLRPRLLWVDYTFPVFVRPAGRSDSDFMHRGIDSYQFRFYSNVKTSTL